MSLSLNDLWDMIEEKLEQHETDKADVFSEVDEDYHDGWIDSLLWMQDILEPELYRESNESNDEW